MAIFGGSFNPIHIGHLIMAENALTDLKLDEVIFSPAGDPPHKSATGLAPAADRFAMVAAAITGRAGFSASRIDLEGHGPSYTWRLLERFAEEDPGNRLWFLMGGDSLQDFPSWQRPDRILELARLAVVERPGYEMTFGSTSLLPDLSCRADRIEAPLCDVSSTDIRERIQMERSIRFLVPESVRDYIEDNMPFG